MSAAAPSQIVSPKLASRVFLHFIQLIALALLAAGCYKTHPCPHETCDGKDNDCDFSVDEDFRQGGHYLSNEHCGACGLSCAEVFPTAASTECRLVHDMPMCRITACAAGEVQAGDGACIAVPSVLCMPCSDDAECAHYREGARCISDNAGAQFCGQPCGLEAPCAKGFRCVRDVELGDGQCQPNQGSCVCTDVAAGTAFGCELSNKQGDYCLGQRLCTMNGIGECEPALDEVCNYQDDDCDDVADEDFVDSQGRYLSIAHCGSCEQACVPPGPNMISDCVLQAGVEQCQVSCLDGFVDVDQLAATGCECELQTGPAVTVDSDRDCDGVVDPTPNYVFVSTAGDDTNSGTKPDEPLATLQAGFLLAAQLGYPILVARGPYQGPFMLPDGIAIYGGYSPDFRARDATLYPVVLEAPQSEGAPAVVARGIAAPTVLDSVTIYGTTAQQPGQGSTALYLDRVGDALKLHAVTVFAAAGASGEAGQPSSSRLAQWGFSSLLDLAGVDGKSGLDGNDSSQVCATPELAPGMGGDQTCHSGVVSGGHGGGARCPDLPGCDNAADTACGNAGCTDFTSGGICDLNAAKAVAVANPDAVAGQGVAPGDPGQPTYNSPTNRGTCEFCDDNPTLPRLGGDGGDGAPGAAGAAGLGCESAAVVMDASGQLSAMAGGDGKDGKDGSGGGGGTAGAGYAVIANTAFGCMDHAGGSGGGGGSGGCAAPGASGGNGGGASVGIVIRLSDDGSGPALSGLRVVTAAGGDGGAGGTGAEGGAGGLGGSGGLGRFWCAKNGGRGGDGGSGGAGGGGAGGCGGPSVGIYLAGPAVAVGEYGDTELMGVQVDLVASGGRGGAGGRSPGQPGMVAPAGSQGNSAAVSLFSP